MEEEKKPNLLTSNTFVPIGMIVILSGIIMWVTLIFANGNNNSESIRQLQNQFSELQARNIVIIERLAAIQATLDLIAKQPK